MAPPTRIGFGTRVIERVIAGDLGGRVTMHYNPDGLRYELSAPLENLTRV